MTKSPTASTPASPPLRTVDQFLWDALTLTAEKGALDQPFGGSTLIEQVKTKLQGFGVTLNPSQWDAWTQALGHRLTLIWGPPGTGKSETLRALLIGLYFSTVLTEQPIRVLVSAANYTAFDNLIIGVALQLSQQSLADFNFYRLRSQTAPPIHAGTTIINVLNDEDDADFENLSQSLNQPNGMIVVAATPSQVYNFVTKGDKQKKPIAELFDFIIIDEASQLDIGHSLPIVCAATNRAQIVLAGDPLQLAPISKVEPPVDTEYLVGSVYTYIKERFALSEQILQINYRSNDEIVSFGRALGYDQNYQSYSPVLRLNLTNVPIVKPTNWPNHLAWSNDLLAILDPQTPIVCVTYREGRSGQSNRFESQALTSLIWLLYNTQPSQALLNETGQSTKTTSLHSFDSFWQRGVGVVTPHSAQRALIISDLKRAFGATFEQSRLIRDAVDTVERFQGQQRDVIIASFAVGDPDVVALEDEFLFMLNRFNVMTSRPRAKLIVFITDEILDHLSNDYEVLKNSRALKLFAGNFCRNPRQISLGWHDSNNQVKYQCGIMKTFP